jgi:hypothetical protein
MKKIMITLAMMLTLITVAFAGEGSVKAEVLQAFKTKFTGAKEVNWSAGKQYAEASFLYNDTWLTAYYNDKAELIGVSHNISSGQLPFFLQNNLKKNYAGYWITDLFELSNQDGFSYYVTVRNADEEVVLESLNGRTWQVYRSTKI